MQAFTTLTGAAAPLMRPNIDTGTIIPSRFMRSRSIDLGAKMFSDWRYALDGSENPEFVLNQPRYRNSRILLGGINFGCGSSREAAVYALMKFGVTCIIAPSFGEIFTENAYQNGLLPITLAEPRVEALAEQVEAAPEPVLTVDLTSCRITGPDGLQHEFEVPPDRRAALLEGLDETSLILRYGPDIDAFRTMDWRQRPWLHAR